MVKLTSHTLTERLFLKVNSPREFCSTVKIERSIASMTVHFHNEFPFSFVQDCPLRTLQQGPGFISLDHILLYFLICIIYILEPTVRAVKTRIECRGQKEPRNPRQWLEISPEGKVQATENQKSESTLFYLVPIGLRKRFYIDFIGVPY